MRLRRYPYKKYLLIVGVLFLLFSLPPLFVEGVRGRFFALCSPLFRLQSSHDEKAEINRLEIENHLLWQELSKWEEAEIKGVAPARVIYRDPSSWSSSLWIDVGKKNSPLIQKNSPVVVGMQLVGVIDYVGRRHSRVRLITDVALKPSVRVFRGVEQHANLLTHIDPLLKELEDREDLPLTGEQQRACIRALHLLQEKLEGNAPPAYLAKGIVQGAGSPLWRSRNQKLRGIGFNYDFPDEYGPARELRSGKPVDSKSKLDPIPLIACGDLLITTGMDGVFPPGLHVGIVSKVYPLVEGACTYDIEAKPALGNLDDLESVCVMSPLEFNEELK